MKYQGPKFVAVRLVDLADEQQMGFGVWNRLTNYLVGYGLDRDEAEADAEALNDTKEVLR
jgi:hypothetical protein